MPYIINEGVKIYYRVEGSGEAIILQHGFFGSSQDFYEWGYVEELKKDYKLIIVDGRGHGKSDKPHDPKLYELKKRGEDIIKVMDAEGINKCHYMGYSMGGWISFALMRDYEERFYSFILDAIHPFENDMFGLQESVKSMEDWVSYDKTMSEECKERFLENDKKALLAAVNDRRVDNSELLRNLQVPCLLMDGDKDTIYEKVLEASKLSDNIKFITIKGADHSGSFHESQFVLTQMKSFLKEVKKVRR
jgi:pimeloyl-ACP methyl ester carboxylesterase